MTSRVSITAASPARIRIPTAQKASKFRPKWISQKNLKMRKVETSFCGIASIKELVLESSLITSRHYALRTRTPNTTHQRAPKLMTQATEKTERSRRRIENTQGTKGSKAKIFSNLPKIVALASRLIPITSCSTEVLITCMAQRSPGH